MNKTLIVGGGRFPTNIKLKEIIKECNCIIGVDKGYEFLVDNNIKVDFLLGDFDSINNKFKIDDSIEIIKYPSEKSMTDMDIAIEKAIEINSDEVIILGSTGTRLDHTIINIFLLKKLLDNNILATIIDDNNEIQMINNKVKIKNDHFKYISIIPIMDNTIVTLKGVKYPLNDMIINFGDSLPISNEIIDEYANITTNKYTILIKSKD